MITIGLFLLLGIAIGVRYLGGKLIPLAVPRGLLKVVAVGWLGGLAASLLEGLIGPWEPKLWGIYVVAAVLGSAAAIFGWGMAPFVKIWLGLNRRDRRKSQGRRK